MEILDVVRQSRINRQVYTCSDQFNVLFPFFLFTLVSLVLFKSVENEASYVLLNGFKIRYNAHTVL